MCIRKFISGIVVSLFIFNLAIADSSTSYEVDVSDLNAAGTLSASTNYQENAAILGFVDGNFGYSANYILGSGLPYLELLCGNGILEFGEQCDDGNTIGGDGCNNICQIEACGNGILDVNEECDDGNNTSGDGCSNICIKEIKGGVIRFLCGNGMRDVGEQCDDGNNKNGDGCNSICLIEKEEKKEFKIKARPEKRVNPSQNWGTQAKVVFFSRATGKVIFETSVPIDDFGWGTLTTDEVPDGSYDVSLKGLSHLTKIIRSDEINAPDHTLDFTFGETFYLLAGDVHKSKDDFINALDITATVKALYTDDIHADLNKDGLINALDITITVNNLYKNGESF
jgi:cysteine-rich repeat protein